MITRAQVVADSVGPYGKRIVTMQLEYQRFIHSEFMTHRVFSRNAASSRAIPVEKQIEQVGETPAMPVYWGLNKPGMQAAEEWGGNDGPEGEWTPLFEWIEASNHAMQHARAMHDHGLHKQIVNRLLEPWQIMKVVVTATEWENFFNLRISEFAQPEIRDLAEKMKKAMDESEPKELNEYDWHLPYIRDTEHDNFNMHTLLKLSSARCARVSYLNHDQSDPDPVKDVELADKLHSAQHMSPFEHQATPIFGSHDKGVTHHDTMGIPWSANFSGWIQYRQIL